MRVFAVTCKDGGHIIRSAIPENPMLHTDFTALSSTKPELLPTEILHCDNKKFGIVLLLRSWP